MYKVKLFCSKCDDKPKFKNRFEYSEHLAWHLYGLDEDNHVLEWLVSSVLDSKDYTIWRMNKL